MSVKQDLIATRAIIADPERWAAGAYAYNDQGEEVDFDSDAAVCFCLDGALGRVVGSLWSNRYNQAARFLQADQIIVEHHAGNFADFNDANAHETVIAWLDRKIEEAPDAA